MLWWEGLVEKGFQITIFLIFVQNLHENKKYFQLKVDSNPLTTHPPSLEPPKNWYMKYIT